MTANDSPPHCARCGHAHAFHAIGTGDGVPLGQSYCDDRHAEPCDCPGYSTARDVHIIRYEDQFDRPSSALTSDPADFLRRMVEDELDPRMRQRAKKRADAARVYRVLEVVR